MSFQCINGEPLKVLIDCKSQSPTATHTTSKMTTPTTSKMTTPTTSKMTTPTTSKMSAMTGSSTPRGLVSNELMTLFWIFVVICIFGFILFAIMISIVVYIR